MPRAGILSLSSDLDLPEAMRRIEEERGAQEQGMRRFGTDMDTRLQGIYGQLIGAQKEGIKTTQGIYGDAAKNVQQAYQSGGQVSGATASSVQSGLSDMARKLGISDAALQEVQGRLGEQAMGYQQRNQAAGADRAGILGQLGASMASVMQLGEQAAQNAMAQGRSDIAKRVANELQKINTLAATTRTDFTSTKADEASRAAAQAQKEILQAQKELMRASRSGGRGGGGRGRGGGDKGPSASEMRAREKHEAWREDRNAPYEPSASERVLEDYQRSGYGPRAREYIEGRLAGGKPSAKGLDKAAMERTVSKIKNTKKFYD